jgi:hypothetical protein
VEADVQVAWLRKRGAFPSADELALEFDEGFRLVPAFVARGWLNDGALPGLVQLDEQLDAMSGITTPVCGMPTPWPVGPEWDRVSWWRVAWPLAFRPSRDAQ